MLKSVRIFRSTLFIPYCSFSRPEIDSRFFHFSCADLTSTVRQFAVHTEMFRAVKIWGMHRGEQLLMTDNCTCPPSHSIRYKRREQADVGS